jgi:diguanylate cyclase (GGDEF)-like protein
VIVNLDVNGLKKVNDAHGHSQGDLLLKTFAKNLEEVFRESEHLIRLGGDEFCVIAKGVERSSIEHSLLKLNRLNRDASKNLPFQVTAAYGVAESKEVTGNDAEDVSRLADRRMYDMKTKMKAQTNL